jgi:CDP-diacylglycerol--serine O-phosphatidyltransferase
MNYSTLFSVPNILTLANLCCGVSGILFIYEGEAAWAFYMMLAAAVFDFFDGMAARFFNQLHPIGKDLDSLADVVSFGCLPAVMAYSYLKSHHASSIALYAVLLISAFSALRLAKFNHDTRQSENFIGVPTPMNGLAWGSLLYPLPENFFLQNPTYVSIMIFVSSFMLISEIPMLSFKVKKIGLKENFERYILLVSSLVIVLIFKWHAGALIYWVYVFLGLFMYLKNRVKSI